MDTPRKKSIVIIGGGIIGATTAYYLTRHPKFNPSLHKITLLEATSLAAGASGKAGGLLGLWAYPECLVPLSYRLHKELAEQYGGAEAWGYRQVRCGSVGAIVTTADFEARKAAKEKAQMKVPAAQPGMSAWETTSADALPSKPTTNPEETTQSESTLHDVADATVQVNGHINGAGVELSATPLADGNTVERARTEIDDLAPEPEKDDKKWEKLPKQDTAAASLLSEFPMPDDLDWIDAKLVQHYEQMGRPGATETAQVHPFHFTNAIAELARSAGVNIRQGARVTRFDPSDADPTVRTVEYEDRNSDNETKTVGDVTDVIVTAGPWTGKLLPRSKIEGLRAHSVVYEADVTPYAVFTDIQLPSDYVPEHRARAGQKRKHRGNVDPEVYARPFGEVYACGEPDKSVPLPETADAVQTDEAQCDDLTAYLGTVSPILAGAPVKAKQACYIPQHVRFGTERGPLIGPTGSPGVWIAAGHTCWGVQNGPATGLLMSEWVFDGEARSADIGVLHPAKFKV